MAGDQHDIIDSAILRKQAELEILHDTVVGLLINKVEFGLDIIYLTRYPNIYYPNFFCLYYHYKL